MDGAHLGDQPLPERHRLRVRVVDPEDEDAPRAPAEHDVLSAFQSASRSIGVPVEVVDVLVALGRVLGVLERPVGSPLEPLRVLGQPGVIGRGLDREVERELDPGLSRRRDHRVEVGVAAEIRVERVVPAGRATDRPRAARVALARLLGIVASLAMGLADRMHGRQVDDVEAERRDVGQHGGDAAEAAPGAWKELVPGAEPGQLAVDVETEQRALDGARGASRPRAPPRRARHSSTAPSPNSTRPSESSPRRSACPAATLRSYSSSQLA